MRLFEFDNETLPDSVVQAFVKLGDDQRDIPERAMLKAQRAIGGGVLNYMLEHVGDLTHRMSHMAPYNNYLHDIMREKLDKTLRVLTSGYGFEREHEENMKANQSDQEAVAATLRAYAEAHSNLVVYNRPQWLARQAAVSLGNKDFVGSVEALQQLDVLVGNDPKQWAVEAAKYELDQQGNPIPFQV